MITRRDFLATGVAATALVSACRQQERAPATTPALPAAEPPGVPQVLVVDAGAPFAGYLVEVLAVEGVLGIARADGRLAVPASLARVQAVAVHGSTISDAWLTALDAFVQRGGALVGMMLHVACSHASASSSPMPACRRATTCVTSPSRSRLPAARCLERASSCERRRG